MDQYVTGAMIRRLRESKGLTQATLADRLAVSDKTVSKWETGKGYPDITLLQPIAAALGVSVTELLSGQDVENANRSANLRRGVFYVCPVCGNVIFSVGAAAVSCHGLALPPLTAEAPDAGHGADISPVEDEYYVEVRHPMTRGHFISFLAAVSDSRAEIVKCYPEGPAAARFKRRDTRELYFYCNQDGLFRLK